MPSGEFCLKYVEKFIALIKDIIDDIKRGDYIKVITAILKLVKDTEDMIVSCQCTSVEAKIFFHDFGQ